MQFICISIIPSAKVCCHNIILMTVLIELFLNRFKGPGITGEVRQKKMVTSQERVATPADIQ